MDDVRWQHRLRIKGIPGVLSEDEVRSLLKHYGATQIRVLTRQVSLYANRLQSEQ